MTTPKEIISQHIGTIQGIRIPMVKFIVESILKDLEDHGYIVIDRTLPAPTKTGEKNATQ